MVWVRKLQLITGNVVKENEMKGFTDYTDISHIGSSHMDDYGRDSANVNLITEAGLSRLLQRVDDEKNDFVMITAYRAEYTKSENVKRNRIMRGEWNKVKLGPYQLVGHWRECSIEGTPYDQCPEDKLVDAIERSYLVVRTDEVSAEKFWELANKLAKDNKQDAIVVRVEEYTGDETWVIGGAYSPDSPVIFERYKKVSLGKIAQGWSQHVKKMDVPFTFEGVEIPGSNSGRMIFSRLGLLYPVGKWDDMRNWEDIYG